MKLTPEHFIEAKQRLSPHLKNTPVFRLEGLEKTLKYESPIYLKLETEQPTGSFKVRGAFNVLLQLPPSVDKVVTFSMGNFAQAVAYGAGKLEKKAMIVMPKNAPQTKINGTLKLGAEIIFCGEKYEERESIVKELSTNEGYFPLHPYNNYETMIGQGTLAIEVLESNPYLKHFFSPVGGGGLLSGCAPVLKEFNDLITVYSVEPIGAEDFYESFHAKKHIVFEKINTIADGLRATTVGNLNYPILMSTVDEVLAVSEEEIIDAMRLLWKEYHLITEPSGAVALAGFLAVHQQIKGEVVILITGKNVDQESFNQWVGI